MFARNSFNENLFERRVHHLESNTRNWPIAVRSSSCESAPGLSRSSA